MSASVYEQDHATSAGVRIIYGAAPKAVLGQGAVSGVEFAYEGGDGFTLTADQVFLAIGQSLHMAPLAQDGGKLVAHSGKIWTGGDCAVGGADLTVTAVAQGRDAAEAIHAKVMG
jgi:glutamate synthase (NADPH/NADH) small chain